MTDDTLPIPQTAPDLPAASQRDPRLYILMRTDLASLNPGKACAQAAHAANQFVFELDETPDEESVCWLRFQDWQAQTPHGFGTTITLAVDERQLRGAVALARKAGFPAAVTHDPTYPLQDGQVTHILPLDTCGYIFGEKSEIEPLLRQYDLMP
jgi:peptidyl-tRNA hydrolase